ncbi:MAG: CaiB/BaiF CoA transferase family protein [Candidatus Bathyarchaeia archaeon]
MEELELFKKTTVLSIEQATTLPFLTYRLAVDGMNVIRVEHPQRPDPNRFVGDNVLGEEAMNSYFMPNNVGKKAITLNLAGDEGKEILKDLIRKLNIDIFATNQLPRNYVKLGIDYETLRAIKKDLIWLGITGFGPEVSEAAYDPILQARAGFMDLTGEKDGDPMVFGLPVVDLLAAEHAYAEVMKALFRREATGEGCRIDVSMFQSAVSWLVNPILLTKTFNYTITRRGNTHRFFAPVSVYETRDGYVYIAVGNDRQWNSMTKLPGFESLSKEEYVRNAGRIADVERLNREITKITKTKTTEELIQLFTSIGVPISKVNTIKDVINDPYITENMVYSKDPRTGIEITLPPPPVITPYLKSVDSKMSFPPRVGEHNQEIYGGILGYSPDKINELKEKNII